MHSIIVCIVQSTSYFFIHIKTRKYVTRKWIFMKTSKSDTYKIYKVTSRIILCSHHYSITSSGYITEEQRWEHKIEKRWCPFFFQQGQAVKQKVPKNLWLPTKKKQATEPSCWCFVSNWLALTSFWAGHESIDLWNKLVWGFVRSPPEC